MNRTLLGGFSVPGAGQLLRMPAQRVHKHWTIHRVFVQLETGVPLVQRAVSVEVLVLDSGPGVRVVSGSVTLPSAQHFFHFSRAASLGFATAGLNHVVSDIDPIIMQEGDTVEVSILNQQVDDRLVLATVYWTPWWGLEGFRSA